MDTGFSFLHSKIARRFCTLFFCCAFLPILALATVSYVNVSNQLEEQSFIRLKREAKAYGIGLFDRLVRAENELSHVGRNILLGYGEYLFSDEIQEKNVKEMFIQIFQFFPDGEAMPLWGDTDVKEVVHLVAEERLRLAKPFVISIPADGEIDQVFVGVNIQLADGGSMSIIGEIRPEYLWGIGAVPILPPMTELFVFDAEGRSLIATGLDVVENYRDLDKKHESDDLRVFHYTLNGSEFFGSYSNLFFESRYQKMGWVVILSQSREDVMSALKHFNLTFPFMLLLFLLIILYLSVKFIRKGLEPLEELKEATARIAAKEYTTRIEVKGDDEFAELGSAFNSMTDKIQQQFRSMEMANEIDRAILSATDKVSILAITMQRMKSFFFCDIVMYARISETSKNFLKVYTVRGRRTDDSYVEFLTVQPLEKELLFAHTPYSFLEVDEDLPAFLTADKRKDIQRYFCLPIFVENDIPRVLILGWDEKKVLADDELFQARQIADQFSVALSNAKLIEDLEYLAKGTIEALARTVDAKSRWTSGHSERVAEMGGRIAEIMGFSIQETDILMRGGLLHDIGKIGIPLAILDKPERLNDEEYREVQSHPTIGAEILEPIEAFRNILTIVEQHHEKFDGSGYPGGLKGEEIDIKARVLAVADVWDALVSDRPYRGGWVQDRARKFIVDGAGTHFDPQVVEAFLAVVNN